MQAVIDLKRGLNGREMNREAANALAMRLAFQDGYIDALACCYHAGLGVKKDSETALMYARRGMELGLTYSPYVVGLILSGGDSKSMLPYAKLSADRGNPIAQEAVAMCYDDLGNPALEFEYARMAATQGSPAGIRMLAHCYDPSITTTIAVEDGTRIKSDKKAVELYTKAARLGDSEAQYDLGICYKFGAVGLQKHVLKAVEWLRLAAAENDEDAINHLANIHEQID